MSKRSVLVTGGTKGLGLAIGLAFGKRGADVTLTQKWGSADADEIRAKFTAIGARPPNIVTADASQDEDARAVLETIVATHGKLDTLISNVAFAPLVGSLDDYTQRGLATAVNYTTWPIVAYTRIAHELAGVYPRYVVGMSSEGADSFHLNYDIVAAAKAALEALCRYLNHRLRDAGTHVNVVRTRFSSTESLHSTFGAEFEPFVEKHSPDMFTLPADVAEGVYGLCSGLMDGVGGQVITIDRGAGLFENYSRLYDLQQRART